MDNLLIEATQTTPKVILDSGNNLFEISGESRPENTAKFYNPIISWFNNYRSVLYFANKHFGVPAKVSVDFKLDYFNSTSAKFILDIFFELEKIHKEGYEAEIHWYYDKRDTDMKAAGKEFSEFVPDLPMKYFSF